MRYWYELYRPKLDGLLGKISDKEYTPRKIAESTGRLPPTPTEKTAVKAVNVIKFGAPPAAMPNTPVMKRVRLNEILSRSRRAHC